MTSCMRTWLGRRALSCGSLLALMLLGGGKLPAQIVENIMPSGLDLGTPISGPGGLGVYGISGFIGYADFSVPGSQSMTGAQPAGVLLSGNSMIYGGSATGGWSKKWAHSDARIVYTLNYTRNPQLIQTNGFGHQLRMNWGSDFARKWRLNFGGQASILSLQESLFQPEVLTVVEGPVSTF